MKSAPINKVATILLTILVFLLPLFLLPFTTEYYEMPKLILLLAVCLVLVILRSISWVVDGKVSITRTPLDLPLLMILGLTILSSIFSPIRQISFLGNLPRIHGSAISIFIYTLFFFITTSYIKTTQTVKWIIWALILSAVAVSLWTLASYFGVYLPFNFTQVVNFTPTGSSFSTTAILALLLPLPLISLIVPNKLLSSTPALIISIIFALTIALTASGVTYLVAILGLILVLLSQRNLVSRVFNQLQSPKKLTLVAIPVVIAVLAYVLTSTPLIKNTPLSTKATTYRTINLSQEIQLPFTTSWKISASAFRDKPFIGTGPSTYLFDFTTYKPLEYNNTPYWNIRFDNAFNEFFQTLATGGLLGIVSLLFFWLVVLNFGWSGIRENREDPLALALSISAILALVLMILHNSNTVVMFVVLTILALLMASHKAISEKVEELTIGIKTSRITDSNLVSGDILPLILLIPILILVVLITLRAKNIVLADVHHRNALNLASTQGLQTYNELVKAEQLNPNVDLYRVDLAQTNFALANAIASSKGPTDASPSGSLTDQDKQNIQALLSQSINEGKAAVALNPLSAQNWEILASIYRQISGVAQNALQFSLDAYGNAIQRDPLNPLLRLNVGGVYYSAKNYDLAIRFFSDAVNLKPDFANAYYNLAIALRDGGDVNGAISATQKVLTLVDPKSADYQTASALLQDLQSSNKTASSSAAPPAAAENGALQQKQLPNVLNLPQPSTIATPSAAPKNNQ